MTSKLKILLLVLTFVTCSFANASDNSKKQAVLNDKYIQANLDSIVSTYKAKCDQITSVSPVSLYNFKSMIQGIESNDNFDLKIKCEDTAKNSGVPVFVEFLGHFSVEDSTVITDAIYTSTPGFSFSNQPFLQMLPF